MRYSHDYLHMNSQSFQTKTKKVVVYVSLTPQLLRSIELRAAVEHRTKSNLVEHAVSEYLSTTDPKRVAGFHPIEDQEVSMSES